MSKTLACALGLMAGAACAQTSSVTIYGTIDAGVLTQNKTAVPGSGRVTRLEGAGIRPSVLGFKGSEDLGGGYSAFFNLESYLDPDTGAIHGSGDNGTPAISQPFWRRQANVGLASTQWGSVTLGRQYGPALLAHIGTEPRAFKEQFSNLYAWAYNQYEPIAGTGAANSNNDVGIFIKNAVQYRNKIGPVSGGILYAFGEQPGFQRNNILALGLSYTGPVTLSFSHEFMKDQVTAKKVVQHTGFGAAVPFGDFTFKGNFLRGDNRSAQGLATSKVDAIGVGVDWKWMPNNSATLAYYDNKDKRNSSNHTKNLVISNDYSLSKRTTLYGQLAYVDAKSGATGAAALKTSIVADASFRAGAKTTFLNFGLNHTF